MTGGVEKVTTPTAAKYHETLRTACVKKVREKKMLDKNEALRAYAVKKSEKYSQKMSATMSG